MSLVTDAVATAAAPKLAIVKIVFLTVVVMAFMGLAGTAWYLFGEVKKVNEEKGQLTEQNASLMHDLAVARLGSEAIEAGQNVADQKKADLEKKTQEIRTQLKLREQEIDRLNISLEEKTRLKSQARAQSVWDTFCHVQPNNAVCQKEIIEKADEIAQQSRAEESAP